MILTINKSTNPYDGLSNHLRALENTKLTRHRVGWTPFIEEEIKYSDLVILGNFLPEEVYQIAFNTKGRISYLFCSPFGQASCNGELNLLYNMLFMLNDNSCGLEYLFCADKNMVEVLNHRRVKYLPSVSQFDGVYSKDREGILLLGNNLRTSRNFTNQAAGLKIAQTKYRVEEKIISYNMPEEAYKFYKELMGINNWVNISSPISDTEKARVIAQSRLGMQITYSDAFNIAAWESAMCHVPCLISESLRWGIPDLRVKEIDNPEKIANAIHTVLNIKDVGDLGLRFQEAGKKAMDENFVIAEKTLRECL